MFLLHKAESARCVVSFWYEYFNATVSGSMVRIVDFYLRLGRPGKCCVVLSRRMTIESRYLTTTVVYSVEYNYTRG